MQAPTTIIIFFLDVLLLVVHGDIDADRAHDGHDAGDGVAELDDDGHILGDFLRDRGQGRCACLIVSGGVLGEAGDGADKQHECQRAESRGCDEFPDGVLDFL